MRTIFNNGSRAWRKILSVALMIFGVATVANAQILRTDELEQYAKENYGDKWRDAAENIATNVSLDKNNGITFVQVVEAPDKTAEQLYVLLNYWYTSTFHDANAVINLNDKEAGTIIAQGTIKNVAENASAMDYFAISIRPIIKCDIKDGKVRVTYTVPFYSVERTKGGGVINAIAGGPTSYGEENWTIDKCYPFVKKDKHRLTSSKAFVMTYAYSNVVMDKIEECIKSGMIGNETEDW